MLSVDGRERLSGRVESARVVTGEGPLTRGGGDVLLEELLLTMLLLEHDLVRVLLVLGEGLVLGYGRVGLLHGCELRDGVLWGEK